jgi:hypothetical protein
MKVQCVKCKGRGFCGRTFCPLIAKSEAAFQVKQRLGKEDFFGSAPAPFIGYHGYPHLNVGILSLQEYKPDAWLYDAPKYWAEHNYQIQQIIEYRSELVNSRFKAHIKDFNKMLEIEQEIGMASKPVDVEIELEKKPMFRLSSDPYTAPMGPNAKLKRAKITENPKIHTKVDKVVSDTDLKANNAITYLYEHDFDENFLTKLLSVGSLGIKHNRKLVPTRWSITATDDMIGKHIWNEIKNYPEADYLAFFDSYLGNYYLIMFFPEKWAYELFEMYAPNASWNTTNELQYTTDYENYYGRKNYAEQCAGGYYTVRLAALEKLKQMKRQASVLVLRFITGEYAVPLGVWVTRQAARRTLNNKPLAFASKELMMTYAKNLAKRKFNADITNILNSSLLLKEIKTQSKLTSYI